MWTRIRTLTSFFRNITLHELRHATEIKGTIETKNSIITGAVRVDAHVVPKPEKAHKPLKFDKAFDNVTSKSS